MTSMHNNRLINETSPYLLQHAHNPVDWFPWGEEALEKAKSEDRIILVSIGYAACHWCHVMERESFEDESVAAVMNEHFVNIKIDREERPDLDHIYMDAVQAMTGSGGWPLNVFLTPDGTPFYGGTYFPPEKAFNRASWTDVLRGVQQSWQERRSEIDTQAANLKAHLEQTNDFGKLKSIAGGAGEEKIRSATMFQNIMKNADTEWGGFGNAPKFPQTFTISYLLKYHHFTGNAEALQQALLSIDKMLEGGIYDQVGGGLARYSTDQYWLAPHFEKMLYDNALLINILCDAWQITRLPLYEKAIHKTIDFLQREMMDAKGGFYAAIDADSESVEGKFYVWQKEEIEQVLKEDAAIFCRFFNITPEGNWEENNIPRILKKATVFAEEQGIDVVDFENKMDTCLDKLLAVRNKRIRPALDDKILLGWNALMITALCKSSAALDHSGYRLLAETTFDFVLDKFRSKKTGLELHHTYKNGMAKYPAFLDDYAYLVQACIQLQELTGDLAYLTAAKEIVELLQENFAESATGFFFFTHEAQKDIIIRKKEVYDGAVPSGNSIMAENLFYLALVFDLPAWKKQAEKMVKGLAAAIEKYPGSFGIWAGILMQQDAGINEIVITGQDTQKLHKQLLQTFLPNKLLLVSKEEIKGFSLLEGKNYNVPVAAYVCRDYSCKPPVTDLPQILAYTGISDKI